MVTKRRQQIPVDVLNRRIAELDAIRIERRLTPAEQAEADDLGDRQYQRVRRAHLAQLWAGTRRAPAGRQASAPR